MNKQNVIRFFITLIAAFGLTAQAAELTPHEVVKQTTDAMVNRIKIEQPYYKTQPERMTKAVDEILAPIIDMERISKGVMAKYYKQATPDQQKRFTQTFRNGLMKTYAAGIANYDNNKIEVLPPRAGEVLDPENTPVRMKLYLKDHEFVDIIYTMFKNQKGEWKLKNVIINGINLGLTFRNQFTESMQQNKNNIDKVIAGWSSEVKTDKKDQTATAAAKP